MRTLLLLLLFAFAALPAGAAAQTQCRQWASVPGGSTPQRDSIFARCAVDVQARALPTNELPPGPQVEQALSSGLTVVVNADGAVDTAMTRFWSGARPDLMSVVRRWRFEPAVRNGVRVRSGFMLHVITDMRVDTLPMRVAWTYERYEEGDTLRGRWVAAPAPPPLTDTQSDSIYTAVLRRLLAMRAIEMRYPVFMRCIVMATADSVMESRLRTLARRVLPYHGHQHGVALPGCERSTEMPRVVLDRLHRTDEQRIVTHVSGDLLFSWPAGFDGENWRAWDSRCVATLQDVRVADVSCSLMPKWPPLGREQRPELRIVRTLAPGDSLRVTLIATTPDALYNDTVQFTVHDVPQMDTSVWRGPLHEPRHPGHYTVQRASLRAGTLTGEHVWLRIYTDPAPADLTPVVFADRQGRWSSWAMRRVGTGAWQFLVNFAGPPPSAFRIIFVRGAR